MADEIGHARAGIRVCRASSSLERARAEIEGYQQAHPRGKDGQVVYDLRGHFSTTPDEVRRRFGEYLDRFDIRIEVR